MSIFDLFKRRPARDDPRILSERSAEAEVRIPEDLYSVTLAAAINGCNVLGVAGLGGKFQKDALIAEMCGYPVNLMIATAHRVKGFLGSRVLWFEKMEALLCEQGPRVLAMVKDPKVRTGLQAAGYPQEVASVEGHLFTKHTFHLAAAYHSGLDIGVGDADVKAMARYFPKLAGHTYGELGPQFAYNVRCWRLSHLEDIRDTEFRRHYGVKFNDTLILALLDLEKRVEKLLSWGSYIRS